MEPRSSISNPFQDDQEPYFQALDDKLREEKGVDDALRLKVASYYCALSPGNVLGLGGMLAIPEISGYARLRKGSEDLDFIVNDKGMESVSGHESLRKEKDFIPGSEAEWYVTEKDGVTVTILHNEIRGYRMPEKAFAEAVRRETAGRVLYTIPDELNAALKICRSTYQNSKIHGKDAFDITSTILGMQSSGREFNPEAFTDYLIEATISHAVPEDLLERLDQIGKFAATNVRKKDRQSLLDTLEVSAEYVREKTSSRDSTNTEQAYQNRLPSVQ